MNREPLSWGNKVSPEFRERLYRLCTGFGWGQKHPGYLMGCMAFESAETFSSAVTNAAGSGAVGLIQFMPTTARDLGTTPEALEAMTPEEQLDWVELYFQPYHARIDTLSDMYMAILLPRYIGKPDDSVLFSDGHAYRQNSGLDTDRDGKITKIEAASRVAMKYRKGLLPGYAFVEASS